MQDNFSTSFSVEEYTARVPVREYVAACVDIPKFLECCKVCRNYGAVWSCPPFSFAPQTLWNAYRTLELYGRKVLLSPQLQSQNFDPQQLGDISKQLLRLPQQQLFCDLTALERLTPGSMALAAGSCEGCQPLACARSLGQPCRAPHKMRYSLEALGADVVCTAQQYLHLSMLWGSGGKLPPYYILVGGLLLP